MATAISYAVTITVFTAIFVTEASAFAVSSA
jgi:hypothetical protein